MAEQRGSSMLFSLRGLMGAEAERLAAEAEERRRCHDEILAAKAELALYERAQALRLEARRLVLAEQRRLEAEARAQLEMLEQRHEHERRVAALVDGARRRRERQLTIAALVIAVGTLAGSLGLYFGKLSPEAERLDRAYDELAAAERARAEEAQRLLDRSERARREAELERDRLRRTHGESTRSAP